MVREYVGARYVPKFMNTYDPTQQYEALCVVDNGSGTSYISKVPTPPGTPLTDTDHWAIYGASSGAIINLQNQIDNIENNEIPGLNNQVQALSGDIGDLTDLDTTDKSSIVNAINELANAQSIKNVVFIGDSFCDANRGGYDYGVASVVKSFMKLDDNHFHLYAIGGAGFVANGGGKTFGDLLADAVADLSYDHNEVTEIVIQTAGNDIGYGEAAISNINSNLSSFCDTANQYFPNARIYIAPTMSRMESPRDYYFRRQLQYVLANNGRIFTIISNASLPMRLIRNFADGVHPNTYGCRALGELIATALIGETSLGMFYETRNDDFTLSLDSALSPVFNRETWVSGYADRVEIDFVGLIVSGSIAIQNTSVSGTGSIHLGTESAVVPNTDSATGLAISEIPVRAHATINGESVDLGVASLNIVLIENDFTKCDVYLRYGYCMTAGTATQIAIDPVKVNYN